MAWQSKARTGETMREAAVRIVERTCREQGLPEKLEDPEIIRKVATLLRARVARP